MQWEYRTVKLEAKGWLMGGRVDEGQLDNMLNELGRSGWELVSAFDTNMNQGQTRDVLVIFKRPRGTSGG